MRNIAERAVAVECYKYESEADAILECCDSEESAESKIVNSISRCVRFDTVATLIVERTILSRTRDAVGKRERERGELEVEPGAEAPKRTRAELRRWDREEAR
jgi:hypothetical protein